MLNEFYAYPESNAANLRNGVYVAVGDFDGDGKADLAFGSGQGGGPRIFIISGDLIRQQMLTQAQSNPIANFFAFDSSQRNGVRVIVKEGNGDGDRELVVSSGEQEPPSTVSFLGSTLRGGSPPGTPFTPFADALETNGVFVG